MTFRERLIGTLAAIRPVLEEPGVLVIGSQVPNLLEPDAASTLVVSQDVDIGVPVSVHENVKRRLKDIRGLRPSLDEPSVWVPESEALIEVNFVGMDAELDGPERAYVLEDPELPLLVFGALSLLRPGGSIEVAGLFIPVPKLAGLLIEKFLTDRSGEKGHRDLLVALALLLVSTDTDLEETGQLYRSLAPEMRYAIRSNITVLSLLEPIPGMPDPGPQRGRMASLLRRVESTEEGGAS